jgi:outer membrane receptor protein involved in Fe transport
VPQLTVDPTDGGAGASIKIRGIGTNGTDAGVSQDVAINFDGVQVNRGQIIREALFDLKDVQVLEGPQALFFGKNSPAGVISIESRGPGSTFEANATASYEFDAQQRVIEAGISDPLTDTLRVRVAIRGTDMRGWIKNDAQEIPNPYYPGNPAPELPGASYTYNSQSEYMGRLTVEYIPADNFTATFRAYGVGEQDKSAWAEAQINHCGEPPYPQSAGLPDPFGSCTLSNHESSGALPRQLTVNSTLWRDGEPYGIFTSNLESLTVEYVKAPITYTSVSGYLDENRQEAGNAGQAVYPFSAYFGQLENFHQLTQEFHAISKFDVPVNFSAGVFYEHSLLGTGAEPLISPYGGPDPTTGRYADWYRVTQQAGNVYSAFGQLRWNVGDQIELAGGARYTYEGKNGYVENTYVLPAVAPLFIPEGKILAGNINENNVSPEATLSWHPRKDMTLYAAYKTGYKSGGFAAPSLLTANFTSASKVIYKPEVARGEEVGLKTMLFDDSLRLTATAYRFNYTNLQISDFVAQTLTQTILNAGKSRTQGIEAEAVARVTHDLTLSAGIGYMDARYISFPNIACYSGQSVGIAKGQCQPALLPDGLPNPIGNTQDLSGEPLAHAPAWTWNTGLEYQTQISDALMFGVGSNLRYSSSYIAAENESIYARQGSFLTLDASARLFRPDNRWQIAMIGRNLTNKLYLQGTLDNAGGAAGDTESTVSRPWQLMLELSYQY